MDSWYGVSVLRSLILPNFPGVIWSIFYSLINQYFLGQAKEHVSWKWDIIEKQEHIFGKKTQFKIKLTCTILNLTLLFSKFSYFARFQVNFCLIINLLIFAWHLKFLSLKIVVFFLFRSPFYDILIQCKQQYGTSIVYTIKKPVSCVSCL